MASKGGGTADADDQAGVIVDAAGIVADPCSNGASASSAADVGESVDDSLLRDVNAAHDRKNDKFEAAGIAMRNIRHAKAENRKRLEKDNACKKSQMGSIVSPGSSWGRLLGLLSRICCRGGRG